MERIESYTQMQLREITQNMVPQNITENKGPALIKMSMYTRFFDKWKKMGPGEIKTYRYKVDIDWATGDFVFIVEKRKLAKTYTNRYMLGLLKYGRQIKCEDIEQEHRKGVLYCYPDISMDSELLEFTIDRIY